MQTNETVNLPLTLALTEPQVLDLAGLEDECRSTNSNSHTGGFIVIADDVQVDDNDLL